MSRSRTIPLDYCWSRRSSRAGYFGWQRFRRRSQPSQAENAQKRPAPARTALFRSTTAPVEKSDFPVYLTGLGTVQGFNTVVVRTRVDGQIDKIAFKEGQLVNQGDLLVEIDPRPFQAALDQAKAKKAQDEANLANANLDLQRFTKLGEFATRQQTDTQRSTVAQLTAQIAADDAAISNAQTQFDYTSVKAPISGVAGLRQVDIGNIVNAATQTGIVTIAQIEPIAVIFTAPEEQLPYINEAQSAQPLKVIALTTDGKKALSDGILSVINNQVDTTSGTIRLKAVFDNKDHALWPGQSVSTRLLVTTLKDATVVPDDAVQHGTDGLYAFAVNQDNKAELRKIKVTKSIDGRSVVDEGLSPGEQVITAGQYKVQPGTLVSTAVASSDAGPTQGQAGMSEGISAPFIRYPIGTSLMMAGILFVGLVAYPLLPVAPLPQVDFPTIQITASLPGASPETMASSVAQPLERQFAQIPGVAQMTSTSYLGTAAVTIQFDLNRNIDGAANDVQAAINAASGQLPKNLPSPPTYRKVNPAELADPAAVGNLGDAAADHRQRRRRCPARAADQPDFRRRPGHHRRPAEALDPCPGRSGQTGRQGPVARRRPQPDRRSPRSTARRAISTAIPAPTPSTPTTRC